MAGFKDDVLVNAPPEQGAIMHQNRQILGRGLVLMDGDGGAALYIPVKPWTSTKKPCRMFSAASGFM